MLMGASAPQLFFDASGDPWTPAVNDATHVHRWIAYVSENRWVCACGESRPDPLDLSEEETPEPSVLGKGPMDAAYRLGMEIDMLRAFMAAHPDGDIDALLGQLDDNIKREMRKLTGRAE